MKELEKERETLQQRTLELEESNKINATKTQEIETSSALTEANEKFNQRLQEKQLHLVAANEKILQLEKERDLA